MTSPSRATTHSSRTGGGGATAGELPSDAMWPIKIDARNKTGNAPDAHSEMR